MNLTLIYYSSVGRKILTKQIDSDESWDVTSFYKNPEGTESERLAVYNAVKGVPKAQHLYDFPQQIVEDINFDLIDIESIPFGEAFQVKVTIENKSHQVRNISAVLSTSSIFYTGISASTIKRSQGSFVLNPEQTEIVTLKITPEEYIDKLVDHGIIKIYAIANVQETKQTWSEEDDFTLTKPTIEIQAEEVCKVGEDCFVNFRYLNIYHFVF